MEVTINIPIILMIFVLVLTVVPAVIACKCIQQACIRDRERRAFGGFVFASAVCIICMLIFGGHFIYLLNSLSVKLIHHL